MSLHVVGYQKNIDDETDIPNGALLKDLKN